MKQLIMSLVPVGPLLPDIALGHPSSWALLEPFKHSSSTCSKEGPFLSDSKALFSISFVLLALGANGGGGPLGGGHNSAPLGIQSPPPFPVSQMTSRSCFGGTSLDSQARKQEEGASGRIWAGELR